MKQRLRGRTRALLTGALLLAAQLCVGAAPAQDAPDPRAARVDALFADLNRTPSPGLAVTVVRDGKVLLRKGYGLASIEHRAPITPSTVFDAASVSKQFTGLAVAMLVSEGKVKLGDDIRTYIPELPDLGRPITVAHLLHHTSGIRDWPGTLLVGGWRFDDVISFNQILTMAYNQRGLNFAPGAEYSYSNTNYNLLAEMIRRVTGRPFRAWTDEHLFRPLGMTDTHFRDDYTEVIPDRAFGYARAPGGGYHHLPNNLTALGSSSLFTTADDLARWLINFDEAAVGGRAAMALSRTRGTLNDGTTTDYAFGLIHRHRRGLPMIFHDGGWAAFVSLVVYFPEQRFGVAVLANGSSVNAGDAADKITEIFLGNQFAPEAPSPAATPAAGRQVDLPAALLDGYVGLYRLGPGWYVRVRREGTTLTAQATREDPALMSPRSEREFWVERYGAPVAFERDAAGKVTHMGYRGRRAPKVDEAGVPPPTAEYEGVYESEELGTFYRVAVKDGALEMRHRRHGPIPLARLWRDEFGSPAAFMRSVEFRRDAAGRVNGLVINGDPRSRDIRFEKRR
jgi:CubicO group peptidase (beta-lactamase class C family)